METVTKNFLNQNVDVTRLTGFHVYAKLKQIDQFGIWIESKTETSFIAFNDIKDIRLDKRYTKAGGN